MSTMLRDSGAARPHNRSYFWAPVLVVALGCASVALVQVTDYLDQNERSLQDAGDLTIRAMGSRSDVLRVAEERLEAGRVGFAVYRDLLREAVRRQEPDERVAALESMDKLFASGLAFANDLRKEVASWPAQVLITTTDAGGPMGSDIEKELKLRGLDVAVQKTGDPKGMLKTEVRCYEQSVCQQAAQSAIDVLQEKGYPVVKATTPGDGFDAAPAQNDAAAKLLQKKRIEIVLADEKKSAPAKQVVASSRHSQPHVREKQVVALTGQPAK
jgi:hypothetical protein